VDSHILCQFGDSCCRQVWSRHVLSTRGVLKETVRQNLTVLMGSTCFDMHQGVAGDRVRQTRTPHYRQPLKAQSRHRSPQTIWDRLFDGSTPDGNPRAFLHMSRNVRMEVWTKVRYAVCLVYCETDETGCCFQNHCSRSSSCDSAGTQSRRGGDAWYKEGGVIDQGEEALQRRSR
jgi:hypothetical protein